MKATLNVKVLGIPVQLDLTEDQAKKISDAYTRRNTPVMERISSFEDVLADQGITVEEFNRRIEHDEEDEANYKRLKLICRCLNEGPLDKSKTWHYPLFNRETGAGFGLTCTYFGSWDSYADVGERLCFKNSELAIFAGRTFAAIYQPYILNLTKSN